MNGRELWMNEQIKKRSEELFPMDDAINEKDYGKGFNDGFNCAIEKTVSLLIELASMSADPKLIMTTHLIKAIGKGIIDD